MTREFDAITTEVLWSRLISIVDEAASTLVRTSFSTVVRESYDFSCVLTDRHGNSLAQATASIPSFIGTLPRTVKHFLKEFPPSTLEPGDVLITNDLWLGTGHLPDITVAKPIFLDGELVAFAASVAHSPDIGGKIRSPDAREVFEEGLQIPMLKLMRRGQPDETLLAILRKNVRVPDQVLGDLFAQLSALDVMERGLLELMTEQRLDELDTLAQTIQGYSEQAMRKAIRALPDGDYYHELQTDGLAVPVTIRMKLTVAGDEIHIDYTGSSPQVDRSINVAMCYTYAFTVYPVKCALTPGIPNNEGSFRPIHVSAPEGSILNPRFPAAGGARLLVGHYLPTAVFSALAQVIPDRVIAASGSPLWGMNLSGVHPDGKPYAFMFFVNGGMGAAAHKDGESCYTFPSNVSNTPIEIMEAGVPIQFECKEMRIDSGGAGKFRGGLGQRLRWRNVSPGPMAVTFLAERTKFPAPGLFGGGPGGRGAVLWNGREIDSKLQYIIRPGDTIELCTPGGGGYGDPRERDPRAVEDDVLNGRVSEQAAAETYGHSVAVEANAGSGAAS